MMSHDLLLDHEYPNVNITEEQIKNAKNGALKDQQQQQQQLNQQQLSQQQQLHQNYLKNNNTKLTTINLSGLSSSSSSSEDIIIPMHKRHKIKPKKR